MASVGLVSFFKVNFDWIDEIVLDRFLELELPRAAETVSHFTFFRSTRPLSNIDLLSSGVALIVKEVSFFLDKIKV